MADRYLARIEVYPHSTGRGQLVDQIQAGTREHVFEVNASDICDALSRAELIAVGICCNPIVWKASIKEVRELRQGEYVSSSFDQHARDLHEAAKLQLTSSERDQSPGSELLTLAMARGAANG